MFTLGMPVLVDGGQAGWITGVGIMSGKGQGVWVDIGGRLRLFAGSDLYRLEPATASSTGVLGAAAARRRAPPLPSHPRHRGCRRAGRGPAPARPAPRGEHPPHPITGAAPTLAPGTGGWTPRHRHPALIV
jgi:hypothetical protein